jgi:hypothetical protein
MRNFVTPNVRPVVNDNHKMGIASDIMSQADGPTGPTGKVKVKVLPP